MTALRKIWNNYSLFFRLDGLVNEYDETDIFESGRSDAVKTQVTERWQYEMADFFVQPGAITTREEIFNV